MQFELHREENHYALRDLKTYVKIFYQNYPRFWYFCIFAFRKMYTYSPEKQLTIII